MPDSLLFSKSITVHDKDGHASKAVLAVCPHCESSEFLIYIILGNGQAGRDHEHVQCIHCGHSYCDNTCSQ